MKESIKTIYQCSHCRKVYLRKEACVTHEKWCAKAPNNRHACFSCQHMEVTSQQTEHDHGYGHYTEKTFYCAVLTDAMHSFKAEKMQHSCLIETTRMPLECPWWRDRFDVEFSKEEMDKVKIEASARKEAAGF